jgi:uncharacterized repeat protein (TIGR01451 family)
MVFGMGNPAQAARRVCNTNSCIDKTADADTVEVGEQITFTITQRCPNVTVSFNSFVDLVDTLPSGLSIDSVDANAPFQPVTNAPRAETPLPVQGAFIRPRPVFYANHRGDYDGVWHVH